MFGIARRLVVSLFGLALLGALWITALTSLSSRGTATASLTELGANVLNPYLVDVSLGVSAQDYPALQQAAIAHPDQPLTIPGLKARVLGRELTNRDYTAGLHIIYGHVADAYYDNGPSAVFDIPPQLQRIISTFAVFSTSQQQQQQIQKQLGVPQAPQLPQIPTALQPFLTYIGLSPDTLTAQGHSRYLTLLLYWWGAAAALAALTVLLGQPGRRLAPVAQAVIGGSSPVVTLFVLLWALALFVFKQQFLPFRGALTLLSGVFLPVYGAALLIGIGLRFLPSIISLAQRQLSPTPQASFAAPVLPRQPSPFAPGQYNAYTPYTPPVAAPDPAQRPTGATWQPSAPGPYDQYGAYGQYGPYARPQIDIQNDPNAPTIPLRGDPPEPNQWRG